jgi:hypothetical protein
MVAHMYNVIGSFFAPEVTSAVTCCLLEDSAKRGRHLPCSSDMATIGPQYKGVSNSLKTEELGLNVTGLERLLVSLPFFADLKKLMHLKRSK